MSNELPLEFQYLLLFGALCGRSFAKSDLGIGMKVGQIQKLLDESQLADYVKKGNSLVLSANARTLEWAGLNLNVDLPGKNKAVLAIVHLIRAKTDAYLKAHKISFSEFMRPVVVSEAPQISGADAVSAVRKAYLSLASGTFGTRVLLKDLRRHLHHFDRASQDAALMELQQSGDVNLYSEDNPSSRNEEDEQAALVLADRRRHVIYIHK